MRKIALLTLMLAVAFTGKAQEMVETGNGTFVSHYPKDNARAMEEWRDMRFGMFIHWGPVSQKGNEISWSRGSIIPQEEYDTLYRTFNPVKFDADEWVRTAKDAGMKYIVLTTKHHDGFCLWDTKQSTYNIMNTPFGRDVVRELAGACAREGIRFGAYYSTCDWFHPDFPYFRYGGRTPRDKSDIESYTTYLKRQISELMLNYGPLQVLWFDVPQAFDAVRGQDVIDFAHGIQPDIIINSRTGAKGDFDNPEQRIGGFQRDRAWETCMTIGSQWNWKPGDKVKSLENCIHALVRTAGGDGNLLFNVGPTSEGIIEPEQAARLREMGDWLKLYGPSIYCTSGGPFKPADWGVSTSHGDKVYLHILAWQGDNVKLRIPDIGVDVISARVMNGPAVNVSKTAEGWTIEVPEEELKPIDTIVELSMAGSVEGTEPVNLIPQSKSYAKPVTASSDPNPDWGPASSLTNGDMAGMVWNPASDDKAPWVEIDLGGKETISSAVLFERGSAIKRFELQKQLSDGSWKTITKGRGAGGRQELKFAGTSTSKVRLLLTECSSSPAIEEIIIL